MDFIDTLPAEILIQVFQQPSLQDQINLSQVSQRWLDIQLLDRSRLSVITEDEAINLAQYLIENPIETQINFPINKVESLSINLIQRLFYESFIAGCQIIQQFTNLTSLIINISPSYTSHDSLLVSNCSKAILNALLPLQLTALTIRGRFNPGILADLNTILEQSTKLEYLSISNAGTTFTFLESPLPLHTLIISISSIRQFFLFQSLLLVTHPTLKHLDLRIENLETGSIKLTGDGFKNILGVIGKSLETLSITDRLASKADRLSVCDAILSRPVTLLHTLDIQSESMMFDVEPIPSLLKLVIADLDLGDFGRIAKFIGGCTGLKSLEIPIWYSIDKFQGGLRKFKAEKIEKIENYCQQRGIKLIWSEGGDEK